MGSIEPPVSYPSVATWKYCMKIFSWRSSPHWKSLATGLTIMIVTCIR